MTRIALFLPILLPLAAWAQDAAPPAEAGAEPSVPPAIEANPVAETDPADPATEAAPADPVAAWEADPTAFISAEGIDLGAFEYVARPLVIFADSPRQPQVEEQVRLLEADLEALGLRDVVVILDTDPEARTAVRSELRPRGFGLVLVDKDGRVTLRRPAPLSVREIARAIDRTPLRQEELRLGRGGEPEEE